MGGSDHTNPASEIPLGQVNGDRPEHAAPDDATRTDPRVIAGDELGYSIGDQAATIDTPFGSAARRSTNDGTIEVGDSRGSDVVSDATQASGAGTLGSGSKKASGGPVLAGFADYELIGEVARGGMGVVYRARQISLNRIVAVKMILAGQLASESDVLRFRSEAEAAANLQHPNIVSIYEVGEYGGQHYFSMQFIDGRSLSELVRDGLLPARKAAQVARTVAEAVQYAHDQGILHRDLKPSNILIDSHGDPHLTDFGVAKRMSGESQMTATGAILGTPGYMPPEQAAGKREVGPAADVYALGGILYESLTGRPPFKGERIVDVLMQVMNTEPVSPRVLNPSVPEDLATICLKCLQKEPGRRYATAQALADDLGRWLDGEPIEARPIGGLERSWRWCKRNPVIAGLLAMMVVIGIVAFVGVTSQWLVAQSALRQMQEAQSERAMAQVDALLKAAPDSIAPMLENLKAFQQEINPRLRELLARSDLSDRERLRASLALLPSDPSQVSYLRERLLNASPDELLVVRDALSPYRDELRDGLWQTLGDTKNSAAKRFSAGLALASYDPDIDQVAAERWRPNSSFISEQLLEGVTRDPSSYEPLVEALRPVRGVLIEPLITSFRDPNQPELIRGMSTSILVRYAGDRPQVLAEMLLDSEPVQFFSIKPVLAKSPSEGMPVLRGELEKRAPVDAAEIDKDRLSKRQANAAVALLQLGQAEPFWPLLRHSENPQLRSWLMERLSELKTDPSLLEARLASETDTSARRALLLALGTYAPGEVPPELRQSMLDQAAELFANDPDAGIHSAAEWLIRKWKPPTPLGAVQPVSTTAASQTPPPVSENDNQANSKQWLTTAEGHTLAVIDGRGKFNMGLSGLGPRDPQRSPAERAHPMKIGRIFAIATKEVTIDQFRRFVDATKTKPPPYTRMYSPEPDGPAIMITWYRACQYCRWLSEQAGVPEDQMCYPPIAEIKDGMLPYPDHLERTGFRLPTEAEWEFACRAGSTTSRSYGNSEALLPHYAWYLQNSNVRAWPGGSLKPNDFGLFDMHGNAWEWCQERWTSYWENPATEDKPDLAPVLDGENRVVRGGSFESPAKSVRTAYHEYMQRALFASDEFGFRVVRTVRD